MFVRKSKYNEVDRRIKLYIQDTRELRQQVDMLKTQLRELQQFTEMYDRIHELEAQLEKYKRLLSVRLGEDPTPE